jgi:hypothetical protein
MAIFIGLLIVAFGIVGAVTPGHLLDAVEWFVTPVGLYVAAALRIVCGTVFLGAAPGARTPTMLRVLGILVLLNGILTLFIGLPRARAIFEWWAVQGPTVTRLWAALALAIGAFVIYTVGPARRGRA